MMNVHAAIDPRAKVAQMTEIRNHWLIVRKDSGIFDLQQYDKVFPSHVPWARAQGILDLAGRGAPAMRKSCRSYVLRNSGGHSLDRTAHQGDNRYDGAHQEKIPSIWSVHTNRKNETFRHDGTRAEPALQDMLGPTKKPLG